MGWPLVWGGAGCLACSPSCPVDVFSVDVEAFAEGRCHFGRICIAFDHFNELFPLASGDGEPPMGFALAGGPDGIVAGGSGIELVELQPPVVVLPGVGSELSPVGVGAELAPKLAPAVVHAVNPVVGDPFGEHGRVSSGRGLSCSASRPLKATATSPVKEACCASRSLR